MGVSIISHKQDEMLNYLMKENEELRKQNESLLQENQRILIATIEGSSDKMIHKMVDSIHDLRSEILFRITNIHETFSEQIEENDRKLSENIDALRRLGLDLKKGIDDGINYVDYRFDNIMAFLQKQSDADVEAWNQSILSLKMDLTGVLSQKLEELVKYLSSTVSSLNKDAAECQNDLNRRIMDIKQLIDKNYKGILEDSRSNQGEMKSLIESQTVEIKNAQKEFLDKGIGSYRDLAVAVVDCEVRKMEELQASWTSAVSQIQDLCRNTADIFAEDHKQYGTCNDDLKRHVSALTELTSQLDTQYHNQEYILRMEKLTQDSRQLLEIQHAINDLWEIMKAVWVDSLISSPENK